MGSSQVALVEKEGGPRPSMELSRWERALEALPSGPRSVGQWPAARTSVRGLHHRCHPG